MAERNFSDNPESPQDGVKSSIPAGAAFPGGDAEIDDLGILGYLFCICRYLKNTPWEEIEIEYIMESLESLAEDMENLESAYLPPAPPGGSKVREFMLDAVFHILNAMEEIAVYMEENDSWHLKEGIEFLNSADTIVESLLSTVSQGRLELAEYQSAVKRGDILKEIAAPNFSSADSPADGSAYA